MKKNKNTFLTYYHHTVLPSLRKQYPMAIYGRSLMDHAVFTSSRMNNVSIWKSTSATKAIVGWVFIANNTPGKDKKKLIYKMK